MTLQEGILQALHQAIELIEMQKARIVELENAVEFRNEIIAGSYDSFVRNQETVEAVARNNREFAGDKKLH